MRIFLILLCVNICTGLLHAAFESPEVEARAKAIANAVTSKPVGASTTVHNPSLLSTFDKFSFGFSFFPRSRGVQDGNVLQASASSVIPIKKFGSIGISFNSLFTLVDGESIYTEYEGALGLGIPLGSYFQIGVTALMQMVTVADSDIDTRPTANATVGLTYNVTEAFGMGLVGLNLVGMDISSENSDAVENVPREIRYGLGYRVPRYTVVGDIAYKFGISEYALRVGGEVYFSNQKYIIGAGLELVELNKAINLSLGFTLNFKHYEVGYGFSYPLASAGGFGDHVISMVFRL